MAAASSPADLDSHDASARALARRTGAIVVSVDYRLAPEHKFPAAHDDAWAAWSWLTGQVRELGGDPRRLAVAGEDAGANLAANVALRARDEHTSQPVHQLLIHPIAGSDMATASYGETLRARPVGLPAMRWRFRHLLDDEAEMADPRLDLVPSRRPGRRGAGDHHPGRYRSAALGRRGAGRGARSRPVSPVNCWTYEGVTQGFFGLGLVVTKALFAQSDAAEALAQGLCDPAGAAKPMPNQQY